MLIRLVAVEHFFFLLLWDQVTVLFASTSNDGAQQLPLAISGLCF